MLSKIVLKVVFIAFSTVLMIVLIVLIVVLIMLFMAFHTVFMRVLIASQMVEKMVLIVFSTALITEEITPRAVEIMALIALHTALTIFFMASHIAEKKVLIPSHALCQSPVNTPAIKSIRPPNASNIFPITSATTPATVRKTLPTVSRAAAMYGATVAINHSMNG